MMDASFRKYAQRISQKLFLSVLFFCLALFIFALAVEYIFVSQKDEFDHAVFHFFNNLASDEFYSITRIKTFFGTTDCLLPCFLGLLLYFLVTKQKKYAIELGILGATCTGLLFGLKAIFKRERPQFPVFEHVGAYSFPSSLLYFSALSFTGCGAGKPNPAQSIFSLASCFCFPCSWVSAALFCGYSMPPM